MSKQALDRFSAVIQLGRHGPLSEKDYLAWEKTYGEAHDAAWAEAKALPESEHEERFRTLYYAALSAPFRRKANPEWEALTERQKDLRAQSFYADLAEYDAEETE